MPSLPLVLKTPKLLFLKFKYYSKYATSLLLITQYVELILCIIEAHFLQEDQVSQVKPKIPFNHCVILASRGNFDRSEKDAFILRTKEYASSSWNSSKDASERMSDSHPKIGCHYHSLKLPLDMSDACQTLTQKQDAIMTL